MRDESKPIALLSTEAVSALLFLGSATNVVEHPLVDLTVS
jgi:hypothetical protein